MICETLKDDRKQSSSSPSLLIGDAAMKGGMKAKQALACCWFGKFLFWSRHFRGKANELPNKWDEKKCIEGIKDFKQERLYTGGGGQKCKLVFLLHLCAYQHAGTTSETRNILSETQNKKRFFFGTIQSYFVYKPL